MNCSACQQSLQERLDERAPAARPVRALARHLEECDSCQELFAAWLRLERGLLKLPAPVPPDGLAERIVGRVQAERAPVTLTWPGQARAVLAVAALFLLALLPVETSRSLRTPSLPREPGVAAAPSIRDAVAEAGTAVVGLTQRAADETLAQTRLFLPVVFVPPVAGTTLPLPEVDEPLAPFRDAGMGLTAGLEPVAESARRVFGLFIREPRDTDPRGRPGGMPTRGL